MQTCTTPASDPSDATDCRVSTKCPRRLRQAWVFIFVCWFSWLESPQGLAGAESGTSLPPDQPLTRIQDIRRLSKFAANLSLPVHIVGICTYQVNGEFFVHDGDQGIWVSSNTSVKSGIIPSLAAIPTLTPGTMIELTGVTSSGEFARQILPDSVKVTGTAILPNPKALSTEQLISGSEDGQVVEIEGVVQEVRMLADRTVCAIVVDGINCWFALNGEAKDKLPPLVDARVRARGIFAPDFNNRSEVVAPKFVSCSANCIQILQPPPSDPFDSQRVPLDELRSFSPEPSSFHRKVTSGLVTFVHPGGFFFLSDGSRCVKVSSDRTDLKPGWFVDVAGFIDTSDLFASVKFAVVKKISEAMPPPPADTTAKSLLGSTDRKQFSDTSSNDLSGQNVRLQGTIRRIDYAAPLRPVSVWLEDNDLIIPAHFPANTTLTAQQSASWQIGAFVEITGACELDFPNQLDPIGVYRPNGLHLWVSSPSNVRILRSKPWWTPERFTIALASTAMLALAGLGGVAMLRRQIKQKVGIIARELETNAISTERDRMARDLHDTLEQHLTGVAMQLESLSKLPAPSCEAFTDRLNLANRMIQHSREEARRSVWDLRNQVLESHGLPSALESLAASAAIDGGPSVSTRTESFQASLHPQTAYQLLRIAQESVANALKHARASSIVIELSSGTGSCTLTISDNGTGFDTHATHPVKSPHFGLIGMRERASRIGATLEITSIPGKGCIITVTLPNPTTYQP